MAKRVIKRKFDENKYLEDKISNFFGNMKGNTIQSIQLMSVFAPVLVNFVRFDKNEIISDKELAYKKTISDNLQKLFKTDNFKESVKVSFKLEEKEKLRDIAIKTKSKNIKNINDRQIYFEKEILKNFDVIKSAEIMYGMELARNNTEKIAKQSMDCNHFK